MVLPKNMIFLLNGSKAGIVSHNIFFSLLLIISTLLTDFTTSISSNTNNVGLALIPILKSNVLDHLMVCHNDLAVTFTHDVLSKLDNDLLDRSSVFLSIGNRYQ